MGSCKSNHPLDKLIPGNSNFLLEALIPFVDFPMKKMLILFIKVREITQLMESLNDVKKITECGFDCKVKNTDELLDKLCDILPDEVAGSIKQTIKMINMMEIMNQMDDFSPPPCDTKSYEPPFHEPPNYEPPCHEPPNHEPPNYESASHKTTSDNLDLFESVMSILDDYDHPKK